MQRVFSLSFVLLLHAAILWALWQHRLIPAPHEAMTLFVNFIAPPAPVKKPEPSPPPKVTKPKPTPQPAPRLVAQTPIVAPTDYVAPPPPPEPPRIEAPLAPPPPPAPAPALPAGPVALGSELSVACPERTPPSYPAIARRLGEEGTVVLRVELDETGAVVSAQVKTSSGFSRLDEAALAAVKTWRCEPARRNGQPVRAVALQPFKFLLQ
ncbi:energy transducer TonB [Sulfuricystis multivorans]|uniref:energy transducer TonB n=1 Tax=Sulfuricystis multivorans TaxID=2211108 RepID=UPI000F8470E5|nr:energy transducer TonB [Sulfuricystis multivorans]